MILTTVLDLLLNTTTHKQAAQYSEFFESVDANRKSAAYISHATTFHCENLDSNDYLVNFYRLFNGEVPFLLSR